MSSNNNNNNKVWLVSGTSSGIGLSLVQKLVLEGYKVTALTRSPEELEKQVSKDKIDNLLALKTDITSEASVKGAVEKTIQKFGRIDIVVNNAGYGYLGAVEESSLDDFKLNYEINLFAVMNIVKQVMPHLRSQGSGLILNVASYLAFTAVVGNYTSYIGSKFALNGFTVALDQEVSKFGIRSVLVSPGGFRTKFLGGNLKVAKNPIPEYKSKELEAYFNSVDGTQIGDPDKAALAFIKISQKDPKTLPSNIFFGSDSYQIMKSQIEKLTKELEENKELTFSTDY
ncbi:short-chain dehydrogenase/reductase (SDR) family protein [Tieghemostelium lacteum]|uniref:Short-chain dehydrogenase/reductase (SDR) family protein n=1 Tax=Tieghemostelium lacteum TaxID=361077 RepID=A0A152A1V5_TIELA|nr:short-chain dehydrogenase/reductase (SDR) family protein [Tieghemostelium lacteum]|eukprot:KYR00232.1 short-chain dehydrogenase/reductase (SDR) family protein [Tieghemostelium lacteum]